MRILIVHAIERETLNIIIKSGEEKGHYVKTCKLNNIEVYDGKIFSDKEDITSFDVVLFREIRDNNEEAKMITTYLNENNKTIIDQRIKEGKGGSKINTYLSLSKNNIPYPKTIFFPSIKEKEYSIIANQLGNTFITKVINGQQGKGVYLVKSKEDFDKIKENITNEKFLFQEFIPNDGDIRVLIVGNKILGAIKRTAKEGEFRNNIALGGSATRIDISEEIQEISLKACEILGLEIAGVDVIINNDSSKPYILEVNRSPEFEGFTSATGINVGDEIISFLEQKGKSL